MGRIHVPWTLRQAHFALPVWQHHQVPGSPSSRSLWISSQVGHSGSSALFNLFEQCPCLNPGCSYSRGCLKLHCTRASDAGVNCVCLPAGRMERSTGHALMWTTYMVMGATRAGAIWMSKKCRSTIYHSKSLSAFVNTMVSGESCVTYPPTVSASTSVATEGFVAKAFVQLAPSPFAQSILLSFS